MTMTTEVMKIINPSQIDGMPTMDSRIEINGESLKVTSSEHDANQKCLKIGLENGVVVTFQFPNDFEPSK